MRYPERKKLHQRSKEIVREFGAIDILVNNAAVQYPKKDILDITEAQIEKTFRTNIFSMFYLTKAVLPYMKKGSAIINTSSVTAYRGSAHLLDYSATKGAIISFPFTLLCSCRKRNSCKWRCTRPCMDSTYPIQF